MKITQEQRKKIIDAYTDNLADLTDAIKNADIEEEAFCEGFECAMIHVMGILNIT